MRAQLHLPLHLHLHIPQVRVRVHPQLKQLENPQWLHTTRYFSQTRVCRALPLFRALRQHDPASTAVVVASRTFRYADLLHDVVSQSQSPSLRLSHGGEGGLKGRRVAFLMENNYDYVVTLLSILAADGIAVPLSSGFPVVELRYIMENSGADLLITTEKFAQRASEVVKGSAIKLVVQSELQPGRALDPNADLNTHTHTDADADADAGTAGGMMLYTSGTTSRPKGVFLPQSALTAQASSLIQAWKYSPQDRLLHLLPLHHIHGTVNAILTPIMAGSSIEFMFPFNPNAVWRRLAAPFTTTTTNGQEKITFLTAVPTIYTKLLSTFSTLPAEIQPAAQKAISPETLRLNISGSAALPTPTKQAWQTLSNGNVLLERYGMTEVGMAISGGLDFADRVDGSVGWPLPSVEARLVDTDSEPNEVIREDEFNRVGEIHLRGPCVFKEYWGNPKATHEAFVTDENGARWFKTGDMATRLPVSSAGSGASGNWAKGPLFYIQGRQSVDIIKTAGEKVSALEVERELLSLPQISEAAVLPLPSETWGQKVAAVVVATGKMTALDMRKALKDRLAPYKIPVEVKVVDEIPRNAMGKVNKKSLVEVFM